MAEQSPSFAVRFADLWVHGNDVEEGEIRREPVSAATAVGEHLHGTLEILVQGRLLPALGFFGPDDVCFNEWARELRQLRVALETQDGRHDYDEGEQGQPCYRFVRDGNVVRISVVEGMGGGGADPEWTDVTCSLSDLDDAVRLFENNLRAALVKAAGDRGADLHAELLAE